MFFSIIKKLNSMKNFPFYISTPIIYGIGGASEQILLASSYAKILGKKILIFKTRYFPKLLRYKICNNALFDSLILNNETKSKGLIYLILDFIIQIEFVFRRTSAIFFKKYLKVDLGENFRFPYLGLTNLYTSKNVTNYKQIKPFNLKIHTADLELKKKEQCYELLRSEGIKDKKFVCLHVRDNNYRKDHNRREYRNSNTNNYIELIKLLIDQDYFVFRLGDKPTPKLNFSNKQFIDIPHSNLKSELMDLFLIKECEFYIGTQSGPMDTAYLFNKPMLLTNMYDLFSAYPRKKNDRGIFKKIVNKKSGEEISIKDFAKLGINYHHYEIDIKDIKFEENSPEELYNAMKEYLNFISKKNYLKNIKVNFEDIQIRFNHFLNERLEKMFEEEFFKKSLLKNFNDYSWKKNEFVKIIKNFKSSEGTLNSSYLKKNLNE